jgi:sugar phosphate isomerase/epimerase
MKLGSGTNSTAPAFRGGAETLLTYCTNVHAGERWQDVRRNLETHVAGVKARVAPQQPFGVGLWLSAQAAGELQRGALSDLHTLLESHGLYVFTLNGFPYGAFHAGPVKERVYSPDWRDHERLLYTETLAELLATLLPEGGFGSISTLPCGFKPALHTRADLQAAADRLLQCVASLHAIHERTGKRIALALEPEPCCALETIDETVAFFGEYLQCERARARLRASSGADAHALLERHLGVCLDACHAAVEFEAPREAAAKLRAAAIPIAKIQLSSGLRIAHVDDAAIHALRPYADPVYLHQVVERRAGALRRYLDLPDALDAFARDPGGAAREWRIHFHVPVFLERMRHFDSTQAFLRELLALQRDTPLSSHLEVETYTWDVLPEEARPAEMTEAIARELRFCMAELGASV